MTPPLPITFLSDYGSDGEFAGVCRAVIARMAPGATVIDLAHGLPPCDVLAAALALRGALAFAPKGVHLAVVDPGVGGARRPLALRCADGRLMTGPDNGLLSLAAQDFGGAAEAVDLTGSGWGLEPLSATFHGRDLFAPAAARLATGASLAEGGVQVDPAGIVTLELPPPRVVDGVLEARAIRLDRFGNVQLAATVADLDAAGIAPGVAVAVEVAGRKRAATHARTFGDVKQGALLVYEDSAGMLALALNGGSAASELGIAGRREPVRIETAR